MSLGTSPMRSGVTTYGNEARDAGEVTKNASVCGQSEEDKKLCPLECS
jgi:hypothetical protein